MFRRILTICCANVDANWQCEINSNVKSFMKMTTYVGGKFTFTDVCAVKSAVKIVIKSAVTSVAKSVDNSAQKSVEKSVEKKIPSDVRSTA